MGYFISRQQFAVRFINMQRCGYTLRGGCRIPRQHDGLLDAALFQSRDGLAGCRFDFISNDDMSGIGTVDSDMDNRSRLMAVYIGNMQPFHQLGIADGNRHAVYVCRNTAAADFLYVGSPVSVCHLPVGFLQALADRMGRSTFSNRRVFNQFFFGQRIVMHRIDFKHAFSQRTRLIEHQGLDLSQRFHIIGTFDEDTGMTGAADTGKETKRHADNQCAGAADNQKRQRPVYPAFPQRRHAQRQHADQRRNDGQCQRTIADNRRINTGKFGNKSF